MMTTVLKQFASTWIKLQFIDRQQQNQQHKMQKILLHHSTCQLAQIRTKMYANVNIKIFYSYFHQFKSTIYLAGVSFKIKSVHIVVKNKRKRTCIQAFVDKTWP